MKSQPTGISLSRESAGKRRKWLLLVAIALITLPSTRWVNAQGIFYSVNTTSDTVVVGACQNGNPGCSLRGAIQTANSHPGVDGIGIDLPAGSVINLTGVLPNLTEGVSIAGPGADKLTVRRNAGGDYRVFNVTTTGTVTFSGMTISNGSTDGGGGGIGNTSGTVNVTNCTLSDNFANGGGGGIFTSGIGTDTGTVNVTNCTLSSNSASFGGGIYNNNGGSANVTNSTLSGNFAYDDGGGVYNFSSGTVTVTNCTLSSNSASFAFGGGIYNNGGGSVNVKSCIIALNTSGGGQGPDVFGAVTSGGFNLIGKNDGAAENFPPGNPNVHDDIVGTSASPIDPKLDPNGLRKNGGPTETIALLPGSPAIDKGTSNGLTGSLTTDQRGTGSPRTRDYPSVTNATNGTDIGAFEFGGTFVPISVSRKTHGSAGPFDIYLPLSGPLGIECRKGGGSHNYKLIMSFPVTVTVTSASVTTGTGSVSSFSVNGAQVTVNLTGVGNAQKIVLTLFNVSHGTRTKNVRIPMGVLLGDTTEDGSVNSSDVNQTMSQSGQPVSASNFREDVTLDDSINGSDVQLVQSKVGTGIP